MTSSDSSLSPEGRTLADDLLREAREELIRADNKAQILLAAVGVIIGVLLGGVIAGDWQPSTLSCMGETLWWLGVVAAAAGISLLVAAITPRPGSGDPSRATYFLDFAGMNEPADAIRAINAQAPRGDRTVQQLIAVSTIARRKYVLIQWALLALLIATCLCVAGVVVG